MDAWTSMIAQENRKTDITLVLEPIDGRAKDTNGQLDKRLFDGNNNLHVWQDPQTSLWAFKYDQGIIPGGLKQKFTNYTAALNHAKQYYLKRNVKIIKEID